MTAVAKHEPRTAARPKDAFLRTWTASVTVG